MSRWTLRRLSKKPQHRAHRPKPQFFALVRVIWRSGKVEYGKLFSRHAQSVVRIHNRNVTYLENTLRDSASVEVR